MKSSTRQYVKTQLKWIKFKLLPLAHSLGTTHMPIYILDATDPTQWQTKVLVPALAAATGPLTHRALFRLLTVCSVSSWGGVTFAGGVVPTGGQVIEPGTTTIDAGRVETS